MKILLTGATGFIGNRLREALLADGHELCCVARSAGPARPRCRWVQADFAARPPPDWRALLTGVDAVINAAGIFRERRDAGFAAVHTLGPIALFDACVAAGVPCVLQVSALGAQAAADTPFLLSKHIADEHLLALPLRATVLQPSLVYGSEGASTQRLLQLAVMPLLPLPLGGVQPVQPVHVDDLVAAVQSLLGASGRDWPGRRLAVVGPAPLMLRQYLQALRGGLGLAPAPVLPLPARLVGWLAALGERLPGALFDRAAWRMLRRGSSAPADDLTRLLGAPPRPAAAFISAREAPALRRLAMTDLLLPLLRASVAAVWLGTAAVSFGLYPVDASFALLARAGVPEPLRPAALYGAATLDLLLGVLTLLRRARSRTLWALQAALIVGYTLIISLRLPEYWLHPYGPLSKNLPLLALLALLWLLEPGRRTAAAPR